MKKNVENKKVRKGKQFTVIRNFNGNMTAEEFVARLARAYRSKENQQS